jgi:hypothetical protein
LDELNHAFGFIRFGSVNVEMLVSAWDTLYDWASNGQVSVAPNLSTVRIFSAQSPRQEGQSAEYGDLAFGAKLTRQPPRQCLPFIDPQDPGDGWAWAQTHTRSGDGSWQRPPREVVAVTKSAISD